MSVISPVPVHCFSITLTQETGEVCIEIQRRRYDELSLKMYTNFVSMEKRQESHCGPLFIGRVPSQCQSSWKTWFLDNGDSLTDRK